MLFILQVSILSEQIYIYIVTPRRKFINLIHWQMYFIIPLRVYPLLLHLLSCLPDQPEQEGDFIPGEIPVRGKYACMFAY